MDLSSIRAWLHACFHSHSMEELLELSQALLNHSQHRFIAAQNRFGVWVKPLQLKAAEPNESLSLSPAHSEVSPEALLTWGRLFCPLGSTREFSSRKGVEQVKFS